MEDVISYSKRNSRANLLRERKNRKELFEAEVEIKKGKTGEK